MSEDLSHYIVNPGRKTPKTGLKAAASTDSAIVTETILKVLKDGGNAIDAGIAGAMVQAAVEPFMTNHTGTVTCLYYDAKTGKTHQLDSSGTFPSGLSPHKPIPQGTGTYAGFMAPSSCIPGFMPGMKAMHERFGTKPWARLCEDATHWAEQGHPVSTFEYGVNMWGQDFTTYFPEGRRFYMPDGFLVSVGQRFRYPVMAQTLRRVAEEGPDYMITGGWAERFIAKANEMGWKITKEHMTETPPRWLEPVRFRHHEYEVVSLGPPQHQGVFCALALGILKHLGIRDMKPGSADHLIAMAYALRQGQKHYEYVDDPSVMNPPLDVLLDDAYHATLARLIEARRPMVDLTGHVDLSGIANLPAAGVFVAAGRPTGASTASKQPAGSCELSIVDAEGNWLQMMDTLQSGGIPGMVIDGIPMVGAHATFGAAGSPINQWLVKGARERSTIGNTMVLKDGKPVFQLGSPGNVAFTVPQVLTHLLDFKMDPYAAVDAPRLSPMSEDNKLIMEDRVSVETQRAIKQRGVYLAVGPVYDFHMGSYQMCWRDESSGTIGTTADPRRCGVADGIPS